MQSTYYTQTPLATITLGAALGRTLKPGDTVLLFGDLGAGKTHFVKGIAEGLGVTQLVKSPTFAYVNPYPLKGGSTLYHYDLYRMEQDADLTSLGYQETLEDPLAINVVEWADRLGSRLPKRYIRVDLLGEDTTRSLAFNFIYPTRLGFKAIEFYYEEWSTPVHVRAHCSQVAKVGLQVAEAYIRLGEIIDSNLIYTSCMLHDMARVCDFRIIERTKFQEEVSEEKWQRWLALREQYQGQHHANIAAKALTTRGFAETAEVIRLHKFTNLLDEFDAYTSVEKMILYYADKRVKHDQIVTLAERFNDGRARYDQYNTPEDKIRFKEVEKRTQALERFLFKPIDIEPEDIGK